MIILNIIYHISGLLGILVILVCSINLFMTTMILIQNPNNFWIRVVQVLSIFYIVTIIMLDMSTFFNSLYKLAYIIPLSTNKITFLDEFVESESKSNKITFHNGTFINRFYFNDYKEISDFLNQLDNSKCFCLTFKFVVSWLQYEEDSPVIILAKPILVSNDSNPWLISKFINEKIRLACNSYYLEDSIIDSIGKTDGPGIIVNYVEISIT